MTKCLVDVSTACVVAWFTCYSGPCYVVGYVPVCLLVCLVAAGAGAARHGDELVPEEHNEGKKGADVIPIK